MKINSFPHLFPHMCPKVFTIDCIINTVLKPAPLFIC